MNARLDKTENEPKAIPSQKSSNGLVNVIGISGRSTPPKLS